MNNNELWKKIDHYNKYSVSNTGKVKNDITGRILKQTYSRGYAYVCLQSDSGKEKRLRVHRLVAKAFIPNPNNLKTVNHKDLNKLNNDVSNLEWMSVADNNRHSVKMQGFNKTNKFLNTCRENVKKAHLKTSKRVGLIENGKIVKIFSSINKACLDCHTKHETIMKNKNRWVVLTNE